MKSKKKRNDLDKATKAFEKFLDKAKQEQKEKEAWKHPGARGVGKRSYYVG